jgi:hypothetical protein
MDWVGAVLHAAHVHAARAEVGIGLASIASITPLATSASAGRVRDTQGSVVAETLYNGVHLPERWPPSRDSHSTEPPPLPYLDAPPEVIPIDVGRQLFIDEFLIERTTLQRVVHQPVKYAGNPVLTPHTALELNGGNQPVACPFSDGVFHDPADGLFKLWYMAGWFDGTALAYGPDGIHWHRPTLDVVPGTNRVLPPRPDFRRDGTGLWLDHESAHWGERFKLLLYARSGTEGNGGQLLASPDGIHWEERVSGAGLDTVGDNSTLFYNPFRRRWVLSARRSVRGRGRVRFYREHPGFWQIGPDVGKSPVALTAATTAAPAPSSGSERILLIRLIRRPGKPPSSTRSTPWPTRASCSDSSGPLNEVCARGGFPKQTELMLAYSHNGFHWDRRDRQIFLGTSRRAGHHERGYVHSSGGVCLVVGDHLYFYYGAFSGVSPNRGGASYSRGSTNLPCCAATASPPWAPEASRDGSPRVPCCSAAHRCS